MLKNDYILRLIEQFTRVLERILGLKDRGAYREALEILRKEAHRIIGMDSTMLEMLSPDEIARALASPDRIFIAGRVLEEMRDLYELDDEPGRATALGVRAVDLYTRLAGDKGNYLSDEARKYGSGLTEKLAELPLAVSEREVVFRACEAFEQFATAEDMLFELIEQSADRDTAIAEGRSFYQRLLDMDSDTLAAGGLPREEVLDGLEALQDMRGENA